MREARYTNIDLEVIPFYSKVRTECVRMIRVTYNLATYYRYGEPARQLQRLLEALNTIEQNMQHYDECCPDTMWQETRLILRCADAMTVDVRNLTVNESGYEYAAQLCASMRRVEEAVSEMRDLADIEVCEDCGRVKWNCMCDRCEHCHRLQEDCECEHCPYCGDLEEECQCPRCSWCGDRSEDCDCDLCETCERPARYCTCEPEPEPVMEPARRNTTLDYPL